MDINDIFKSLDENRENKAPITSTSMIKRSPIIEDLQRTAPTSWSIDADITKKYQKHGLSFNPQDYYSGSLDRQLADSQSNWDKVGNALAQTIVSEIGLGTIGGFAAVFDLLGMAVTGGQLRYENTLSAEVAKWQDTFRNEVVPIYSRPDAGFGNGVDFGWVAQGLPNLMSSLTLLIPSTAVSKAVKFGASKLVKGVGKSMNAGSKTANKALNTATKRAAASKYPKITTIGADRANKIYDIASTAAISRTLENYQEGREVFNEQYQRNNEALNHMSNEDYSKLIEKNANILQDVDVTDKDAVAKQLAKAAADHTFMLDYANVIFDLIQIGTLRNITFSPFNKTRVSASAKRLDTNAKRFAGKAKSMEDVKRLVKEEGRKKRYLNKTKDFIKDASTLALLQGNEGIEEAWNYISAQEGHYLGETMLSVAADSNIPSRFNDRLHSYLEAPALWESAFWGVLGGIVFSAGGSKLNQIQNNIAANKRKKAQTVNETTGEQKGGFADNWRTFWEAPDTKRVETAIEERYAVENAYHDEVAAIKNGTNPYTKETISSEEEKQYLLNEALNKRRTSLILNAMDSGTIDMLEAYLSDENVQKALVENNITSEEDMKASIREDLAAIEGLKSIYTEQVKLVNAASGAIFQETGETVPLDYLQIIVRENIKHKLDKAKYEKSKANVDKEIDTIIKEIGEDKLKDENSNPIPYKELVYLNVLTAQLAELNSDKKEILKDKAFSKTIQAQELLTDINNKIKETRAQIVSLNEDVNTQATYLLYAVQQSLGLKKLDNKFVEDPDDTEYDDFNKALDNKDSDYFKKTDKELYELFERTEVENPIDIFNQQKQVLTNKVDRYLYKKHNVDSLSNIHADLPHAYRTLALLEQAIADADAKTNTTTIDVQNRASEIHNWLNTLRKAKLENIQVELESLADKYGVDVIRELLSKAYNGENLDLNNTSLSEDDKKRFKNNIDILNINDPLNRKVYQNIDELLSTYELRKAVREMSKHSFDSVDRKDKKSDKDKDTLAEKSSDTDNDTDPKGGTFDNDYSENTNKLIRVSQSAEIGNDIGIKLNGIAFRINKRDNTKIEIEIEEITDPNWYEETDLFDKDANISLIDNNVEITGNIIINQNGEITQKARIVLAETSDDTSSTGVGESTPPTTLTSTQTTVPKPTDPVGTGTTKPSTVVTPTPTPSNLGNNEDELFQTTLTKREEIRQEISSAILNVIKNNPKSEVTLDDVEDIKKLKDKYKDDDTFISEYNNLVEKAKKIADKKEVILKYSTVVELTLKHSTLLENNTASNKKAFNEALEKVITDLKPYFKTINGTTFVNVEALCRYCNDMYELQNNADNTYIATKLVPEIIDYCIDRTDIHITDANVNTISDNLTKDPSTRIEPYTNIGINFLEILKDNQDNTEFLDKIDNLKEDSKLEVSVQGDELLFKTQDTTIGRLPMPKTDDNGASLYQWNDGWKTDISHNNNGYTSELQDLFTTWLLNKNRNPYVTELNEIIYNYIKNPNQRLVTEFWNNPIVIKAVNDGYIYDDISDLSTPLKGIAKIWKYTLASQTNIDVNEILNDNYFAQSQTYSVQDWFDKVNTSFSFITDLYSIATSKNTSQKVVVDTISNGELIIVPESEKGNVQDRIANKHKSEARIAIANEYGSISVAKDNTDDINTLPYRARMGSTFLVIPNGTSRYSYIHAFPRLSHELTKENASKAIVEIKTAMVNRITSLMENKKVYELEKFLRTIIPNGETISGKVNYNTLFAGKNFTSFKLIKNYSKYQDANGNKVQNGFSIVYLDEDNKLQYLNIRPDNITEQKKELFKLFKNNLVFNINTQAILGSNINNNDTFYIDDNGKFIIKIGEQKWEFASYNRFMLDNNLIDVTTKQDNGSNYRRVTNKPITSQNITVKIINDSSTPVEDNVSTQAATLPTNTQQISIITKLNDIINDENLKHKGYHIAKKILNQQHTYNILKQLLPKNIIFVNKNIGGNAAINVADVVTIPKNLGISVPPKTVLIGNEFIELIKKDKDQAFRKLIHENIHLILSQKENEKYIGQIREVYNDFKNTLKEDDKLNKYLFEEYYKNGEVTTDALEEFLIESLTSVELADYLNTIIVNDETTENKKESLLQKLFNILLEVLGIQINKDSLYYKEYKALSKILKKNIKPIEILNELGTDTIEEPTSNQEKETEDAQEEKSTDKQEGEPTNIETEITAIPKNDYDLEFSTITEPIKEIEDELQEIKDKAIANGTFMKAPNGNPTNLTERQWIHVRTKAFKEWFGDWTKITFDEKGKILIIPNDVSKVVDENGEPLVVYHGTTVPFTTFDKSKQNSRFPFGLGTNAFYFTSKKENAEKIAISVDKGDFLINGEPLYKSKYPWNSPKRISEIVGYKVASDFKSLMEGAKQLYSKEVIEDYFNKINEPNTTIQEIQISSDNVMSLFLNIKDMDIKDYRGKNLMDSSSKEFESFVNNSKEGGKLANIVDGKMALADTYFVKEPNQVKSATDNIGTYSKENNNIKYSTRTESFYTAPSIESFVNRFPLEERANVRKQINESEIQIKCTII